MIKDGLVLEKPESKISNRESHFKGLAGADGIRAIACLSVIFHHFSQNLAMQFQSKAVQGVQAFTLLGNTGVSIFFVLSGFLLSYPFWKQYLDGGNFPDIRQYALKRAARIIPGYYASLLVCSIIVIVFQIPSKMFWIRLAAGLTFTGGFHYVTFFPNEINGPFWSISFEVFCYFLMPVFMFGLFKLSGKKRFFLKSALYWIGVFVLVLALNRLVHMLFTPNNIERGWQFGNIGGAKYWMPNYNPVGFFGHFTIGILAAGITSWLIKNPGRVKQFQRVFGFDIIGFILFGGSIVLLWKVRGFAEFDISLQNQPYYFPFYAMLIGGVLIAAPFSKILAEVLDNRFFRFTAKVSFGLYIWHYLIIYIVKSVWIRDYQFMGMRDIKAWGLVCLVVLLVSYLISVLSYKFIEKPVLDRVRKK